MKEINQGIIFSNDIFRIMKGNNALDFNYNENGLIVPNEKQIERLRKDFFKDVYKIFNGKVTIFSEDEMDNFLSNSLQDSWEYPHCIIG